MALKTTRCDSAEYLKIDEDMPHTLMLSLRKTNRHWSPMHSA